MSRHIFLSVRPEFAAKILSRTKTVEFRRTRPKAKEGQPVVVYASSPTMAIVGIATVVRIDTASPSRLWGLFRGAGGISRARYREYFKDAREAHAITLADAEPLRELVGLAGIRDVIPHFQPPQAFNYMEIELVVALGLPSRAPRMRCPEVRADTRPESAMFSGWLSSPALRLQTGKSQRNSVEFPQAR